MSDRRRPSKKDVMLDLLAKSGVFVYLDPRREGVVVPLGFKKQPELMLQIGLNMAVAIRDLEVDDEGITCTLSFNRSPFWCRMPWHAVFALVSDEDRRGVVWAEDAPVESKMSRAPAIEPPRPRLRAVGPDERAPEPEPPPPPPVAPEDVEGEGTCGACKVKWVEDQDACPLCGASREEAFRPAGGSPGDAPKEEPSKIPLALRAFETVGEIDDEPPPMSTEMPEPPALRAVPSEPAPEPPEPEAGAEPETTDDDSPGPKGKAKKPLPPWLRVVK